MDSTVGTWSWGDGSITEMFAREPEFEPPYQHITHKKS